MKTFSGLVISFSLSFISTIANANGLIKPETTTPVELSSRDQNRFVCTNGSINDVFYSEEKGIAVKIDGNSAYVKFLVRSNGIKQEYVSIESEFYIVCDGETYTVIGKPNHLASAKTYRLGSSYKKRVNAMSEMFSPLTIEERAVKATEMVYKGEGDLLRKVKQKQAFGFWREDLVPGAIVSNHDVYEVDGFGMRVKEFRVKALNDIPSIQEIQFLNSIYSESIIAISVIPHSLKQGQTARVFIVEKEGLK